jgi:CDP-diacylglycerol--glycerol-3-phosphate 3-phosphatidyltransferase
MVIFRAVLAPLVIWVASRLHAPELWLGAMIAAACISDIYDGILARRWGTATATLRISDTVADTIFYLGILTAIILRHWPVVHARIDLLIALLCMEAARMIFDLIKFHKMASYHTYTAKIWGLLLAVATIALLCFDRWFWLLTLALAWGILCDIEGLAISAILPEWTHDVKTLRRALELRRQILARVEVK